MLSSSSRLLLGRWRYRLLSPPSLTRPSYLCPNKLSWRAFRTSNFEQENPATSNTPKYEYIEGCERLERYCPGGYHLVKIGDQLCDGRYSMVQFLGHGGSSTVWLASDKVQQKLVAVKIKTPDSTDQEEVIMAEVRDMPSIRRLQDVFVEQGPNGTHRCLVMETGLCSLRVSKVMSAHELLYLSTARAIIADLVLIVQSLHDRRIVHGG